MGIISTFLLFPYLNFNIFCLNVCKKKEKYKFLSQINPTGLHLWSESKGLDTRCLNSQDGSVCLTPAWALTLQGTQLSSVASNYSLWISDPSILPSLSEKERDRDAVVQIMRITWKPLP